MLFDVCSVTLYTLADYCFGFSFRCSFFIVVWTHFFRTLSLSPSILLLSSSFCICSAFVSCHCVSCLKRSQGPLNSYQIALKNRKETTNLLERWKWKSYAKMRWKHLKCENKSKFGNFEAKFHVERGFSFQLLAKYVGFLVLFGAIVLLAKRFDSSIEDELKLWVSFNLTVKSCKICT